METVCGYGLEGASFSLACDSLEPEEDEYGQIGVKLKLNEIVAFGSMDYVGFVNTSSREKDQAKVYFLWDRISARSQNRYGNKRLALMQADDHEPVEMHFTDEQLRIIGLYLAGCQ